jgi:hypothetical protein
MTKRRLGMAGKHEVVETGGSTEKGRNGRGRENDRGEIPRGLGRGETSDIPMLWVVFREDFEGNHAGFDDGGVWLVAKEIDWQVKIRNDALSDRERRGN